jgi:hypothetical protein
MDETMISFALKWLRHFNQYIRPTGAYRLLILDNHRSYAIIQFINYAYENNIILLYLSAHTTYRLQLLDVSIFSPLAIYYSQLIKEYNRYEERNISKRE